MGSGELVATPCLGGGGGGQAGEGRESDGEAVGEGGLRRSERGGRYPHGRIQGVFTHKRSLPILNVSTSREEPHGHVQHKYILK